MTVGDRARWRRIGVRVLYGLLTAAALYVLVRNVDSPNDYDNFLPFGQAALADQMPYDPAVGWAWNPKEGWATWPPAFAPLLARLDALVGQAATIVLWQAANLLGLGYLLAVWVRWLYGRRLSLGPLPGGASAAGDGSPAGPAPRSGGASEAPSDETTPGPARWSAAGLSPPGRLPLWTLPAMIGLLVPARLLLSNFEHTQSNLLILGLAVAGFEQSRRGRRLGGGMALGLSTAFKATSLAALPYLVWRGRWRDLAAAVAGCLATWVALPAALVGPGEVGRWYRGWLEHTGALHLPTGPMNQSLQATLTRWFAPGGIAAAEGPGAGSLGGYGAEPWVIGGALALALAAAVNLTATDLIGGARADLLERYGVVTWSALVLVAAALWALWRGQDHPSASRASS